jgi:hypothetical protein
MNAALKNGQVLQAHTSAAAPLGTTDTFPGDFFGKWHAALSWQTYVLTCPGVALLLWLLQQYHGGLCCTVQEYRHHGVN